MENQQEKKFDYQDKMSEQMIDALQNFKYYDDWNLSMPFNGMNGSEYDYTSRILLLMKQQSNDSNDPRFFTAAQAKELGYAIKYGAKSVFVNNAAGHKDANGNRLPLKQRKNLFENVFHASDLELHIPLKDEYGNPVPLLDKEGNQRFSKKNGEPLYRYSVKPIPALQETEKKAVLDADPQEAQEVLSQIAAAHSDGNAAKANLQRDIAAMLIAAEMKLTIPGVKFVDNQSEVINYLLADKKAFANAVYEAGQIVKDFKLKVNQESIVDESSYGQEYQEQQPVENITKQAAAAATQPDATVNDMSLISQSLAKSFYETMNALKLNQREMLASLDVLYNHSKQLVMQNSNTVAKAR